MLGLDAKLRPFLKCANTQCVESDHSVGPEERKTQVSTSDMATQIDDAATPILVESIIFDKDEDTRDTHTIYGGKSDGKPSPYCAMNYPGILLYAADVNNAARVPS